MRFFTDETVIDRRLLTAVGVAAAVSFAPIALAGGDDHDDDHDHDHGDHTDVLLKLQNDQIRPYKEMDGANGSFDVFSRVHEGELGELAPNFGDQPGFESFDIATGASLGFDLLGDLRVWNGAGFDLAPANMTVGLFLDSPAEVSVDTAPGVAPGFAFATHDGDEAHGDLQFRYNGAADPAIYLLELRIWTDMAGVGHSGSIFLVLNQGLDEVDHEAAADYVEANIVPSPGAAGMLGLAGLAALGRRRR